MDARSNYRELCAAIGEMLRPLGFKGTAGNYYRDVGDVVHVFSVQKSTSSSTEAFRFCLNSGLWSRVVGNCLVRNRGEVPKNTGNCHSSHRLMFANRPTKDLWWTVNDEKDLVSVLIDLTQILVHEEVPRLNMILKTDHLVSEWRRSFPDWIEIISAHNENREPRLF